MAEHIDLLRIPEGLRSSGDPVVGNPFRDVDSRHTVWADATRRAEQELRVFNAARLGRLNEVQPRTPEEALRVIAAHQEQIVTGKFDIWAKRGVHVVWSEHDEQAFVKWLEHYANGWLNEMRQFFPAELGDIDWLLEELRTRLIGRIEYWKSEARRYLNQQAEDRNAGYPTTVTQLRAFATPEQVWKAIGEDIRLRHMDLAEGEWKTQHADQLALINAETLLRKNAGYYLQARIEMEITRADKQAKSLLEIATEVADIHAIKKNGAFYRAFYTHCLVLTFAGLQSGVVGCLTLRDVRTNRAGNSQAAISNFSRELGNLSKRWENKLNILARDSETRDRVAREREIQPTVSMAPTIPPVPDSTSQRKSKGKPKKLTPSEQTRLRVIFGAIQANLEGLPYCRELDRKHLPVPAKWIANGCPKTYAAAYNADDRGWRQRIHDEKYRYGKKYGQESPTQRESIIQV
jgi:hypothetical protein